MTFCAKCGKEMPEGAQFCPNCGGQVGAPTRAEKHAYSDIGSTLVLIGGILAIISAVFPLAMVSVWRGMMGAWMKSGMWGRWAVPEVWYMPMMVWNWIAGFMMVGAVISVVLGIIAIYTYNRVRGGDIKTGGTIAIILGVVMLVTMSWLSGIITLVGGILCYTSK